MYHPLHRARINKKREKIKQRLNRHSNGYDDLRMGSASNNSFHFKRNLIGGESQRLTQHRSAEPKRKTIFGDFNERQLCDLQRNIYSDDESADGSEDPDLDPICRRKMGYMPLEKKIKDNQNEFIKTCFTNDKKGESSEKELVEVGVDEMKKKMAEDMFNLELAHDTIKCRKYAELNLDWAQ